MSSLAYVLINPYTISKSRTGGIIARYIARTELNFVAARMFGPSKELCEAYAELIRKSDTTNAAKNAMIADYVMKSYMPDPVTGRPKRVMMLLFEGENAVEKIWSVTGSAFLEWGSGGTVRDTYGDYISDPNGNVIYFEPAVLVAPNPSRAVSTLRLWASYSEKDGGIIESAIDVPHGEKNQKTLVLLKPDNFKYPSSRAGHIIDTLSMANLRIVGIKKFRMTVAQAENFYGPVQEILKKKFLDGDGEKRIGDMFAKELGLELSPVARRAVCEEAAPFYARQQFEEIVKFMTGYKPSECQPSEKGWLGKEECLALIYEGVDAVQKIRNILGQTDPSKAKPGSVRREFGSNVMINAAHASDSVESAIREMEIVDVAKDTIKTFVEKHYGTGKIKKISFSKILPKAGNKIVEYVREKWRTLTASIKM